MYLNGYVKIIVLVNLLLIFRCFVQDIVYIENHKNITFLKRNVPDLYMVWKLSNTICNNNILVFF